jgi:glycosyltransferase involved in cell wall biosynthesis
VKKDPLFETVLPSKLFECMGVGLPVILAVKGEAARLLARHEFGLTVEPEDSEAIVGALLRMRASPALMSQFKNNALSAAPRYDRVVLADEILRSLERLIAIS